MIEHQPWKGSKYGQGIIGSKRIALVGHSHYLNPPDYDGFTRYVVQGVMDGKRLPFFTRIATWFGTQPNLLFDQVIFFNYLPECVGAKIDKNKNGTREQYARGETRLLRILTACDVHKAIVFGLGLAELLPLPRQLSEGKTYRRLNTPPKHYYWHTYSVSKCIVPMFVLPHPQSPVPNLEMVEVIHEILDFQLPSDGLCPPLLHQGAT
jgi:hypothetical protein